MISQTQIHRLERSCGRIAPSIARPVKLGIASAKPCAASASAIDHTSSGAMRRGETEQAAERAWGGREGAQAV